MTKKQLRKKRLPMLRKQAWERLELKRQREERARQQAWRARFLAH